MTAKTPARPVRIAIPAALATLAVVVLAGLGVWQLDRKQWKETLIANLERRAAAEPVALPPPARWDDLPRDEWEFRRVRLRVAFDVEARPAQLYVSGSTLRSDIRGHGYFVFHPARLPGAPAVAVNRGYRPPEGAASPPPREAEIVGYLRWPQPGSRFVSDRDSSGTVWFVYDHRPMAAALGWGPVAPFYLDLESPVPLGGVPRPGALTPRLRNDHLGYALTWFGLAAVLAACFVYWLLTQTGKRIRRVSL